MDNKRILSFIIALWMAVTMQAQNSIDRMVDNYSSVGGSTFTSAVQRNPKTRRVEKVVKRLEADNNQSHNLVSTFLQEAKKHSNTTTRKSDGQVTIILTEETAKANRIYMIKYDEKTRLNVVVTIIISMKVAPRS